jgi:hypothetical protein
MPTPDPTIREIPVVVCRGDTPRLVELEERVGI